MYKGDLQCKIFKFGLKEKNIFLFLSFISTMILVESIWNHYLNENYLIYLLDEFLWIANLIRFTEERKMYNE